MTDKGAETLGCILGAVIFFALWMAFSSLGESDPCIKQNCNVHRAAGSQYCAFHRQYFDAEYIKEHPLPTRAPRASSSYSYTTEPARRSTPTPTPRPATASHSTGTSSRTTTSSRTSSSSGSCSSYRDVDDYDVDGFYYDNRGDFESEDDAWDYLEDEPDMTRLVWWQCGRKKRYRDEHAANQSRKRCEQMRGKKLDYYWCGFCKGFHLTSNTEDMATAEE